MRAAAFSVIVLDLVLINRASARGHAPRGQGPNLSHDPPPPPTQVLAILRLLSTFSHIVYIDLDIHHCDAVEEAFALTSRVCTISLVGMYEAGTGGWWGDEPSGCGGHLHPLTRCALPCCTGAAHPAQVCPRVLSWVWPALLPGGRPRPRLLAQPAAEGWPKGRAARGGVWPAGGRRGGGISARLRGPAMVGALRGRRQSWRGGAAP